MKLKNNPHKTSTQRKKSEQQVDISEIMNAQRLLFDTHHMVHRTQLAMSNLLSEKYQAKVYLKREDEQKGKTHKIRGSYYKYLVKQNDENSKNGFVCASDGNFAQSLSIIAGYFKVKCVLFIPAVCNKFKLENMKQFGKEFIEFKMLDNCFENAVDQAKQYAVNNKMIFMHPFDDIDVITGYATLAAEIKEDCPTKIDYLIVPSGGGALLASMVSYFKQISPDTQIVCVEPENSNPMYQSLQKDERVIVNASRYCDGSSVKQIGEIPFEICKNTVDGFVSVTQGRISETIIDLYTLGIISEPSGAMTVAALEQLKQDIKGKTVVCIVSGANTDLSRLEQAKEKSMIFKGHKNYFMIHLPNHTGIMMKLFEKCLHEDDTVTSIQYKRKLNKEQSQVLVGIESKNQANVDDMIKKFAELNLKYENINLKQDILDLLF